MTLLVVGLTSMLLYNYYTSSVVSWLLNAATPSIDSLDGLINSDLELIFEDIGYSRGWLDVRTVEWKPLIGVSGNILVFVSFPTGTENGICILLQRVRESERR